MCGGRNGATYVLYIATTNVCIIHTCKCTCTCMYMAKGVDNRGARGASAPPLFWRLSIYRPLCRAMTAFAKETVDQRLYMPFRHWASVYSVHRSGRGTTSARR